MFQMRLNSSFSMTNLSNLTPSTEYRAVVEVEFADKTSQRSEPSVARTLGCIFVKYNKFLVLTL